MGFDPTLGWANVDGVSIFHSNLVHLDQDMKIQPDLATSWELASDGITYSFTLHPEARFSDGSPITGNDVGGVKWWKQRVVSGKLLVG